MITCRAELKTPAGDNGVMVTKTVTENKSQQTAQDIEGRVIYQRDLHNPGKVILRIQNNVSPHWFELHFDESEWYILMDQEQP